MSETELRNKIARALERHLGAGTELVSLTPLTGGANAMTLRIEARTPAPRSLILRCAHAPDAFSINVSKTVEAKVQSVAHANRVPVAEVVAILDAEDGLGQGYLMERVEGDASPAKLLAEPAIRSKLVAQSGAALAAIHRIPIETLPSLPDASVPQQIRNLRDAYDSFGQPSAAFETTFRYLETRSPGTRPKSLVHGDFRTGNLLADESGIRAVLDWELCHLGDPLEDLGWLCVAAWRFGRVTDRVGGFGSVDALRRAYVEAGGASFDDEELRFWEVYGTLRWGVICLFQVFAHLRGRVPSIERAAIGRRVSEVELDLVRLVTGGSDAARSA